MKINKNIAISDTGFVFNPINGESYSVNPIGVEIVNFLKEDRPFEEILKTMLNKYSVDEATFEKDYADFVNILKHHNLIETNE
ncbi:MAG: PqqD family protein [Bacteroidetes bacterium]|nr:PqqD family protein [Bacteroidota bacterium]